MRNTRASNRFHARSRRVAGSLGIFLFLTGGLGPVSSEATAIMDELLGAGTPGATEVRGVLFNGTGAQFGDASCGIDFPPALIPTRGTIELFLRTTESGWPGPTFILDTRGALWRMAGDCVLLLCNGDPASGQNPDGALAGQLFFAIDPAGGNIPCTLPGVRTSTAVNDGAWHAITITYGPFGMAIYVDGVLEDEDRDNTNRLGAYGISVGDYPDGLSSFSFVGEVARIRTSDQADDVHVAPSAVLDPLDGNGMQLGPASPNPLNPGTSIAFELDTTSVVTIGVYGLDGGHVRDLVRAQTREAGPHRVFWDGTDGDGRRVPSGTYVVRVATGDAEASRLVTVIK